jgi:hypothetical protein
MSKAQLQQKLAAAITASLQPVVNALPGNQTYVGEYDNSDLGIDGSVNVNG